MKTPGRTDYTPIAGHHAAAPKQMQTRHDEYKTDQAQHKGQKPLGKGKKKKGLGARLRMDHGSGSMQPTRPAPETENF